MPNNNGNITPATPSSTLSLPFVIPNRKGFAYKPVLESVKDAFTLESVRDRLKAQAKLQDVQVRDVDLNTLQMIMIDGTPCLQRKTYNEVTKSVQYSAPTPMHEDAWRQLYSFLMTPTTSTGSSRSLAEFLLRDAKYLNNAKDGNVPAQMGLHLMNYLLGNAGAKPVSIHVKSRAFKTADGGYTTIRYIANIVSQNYVRLSNLDYIESLLTVPEFRDRKVVDFRTDDRRLYLRMLIDPIEEIQLRRQYRTFDGWNGEGGMRSYGGCDGLFRWNCYNGQGNHLAKERYSWPHVGSRSPAERVRNALGVIMQRGTAAQQAYDAALQQNLTDGFAFMEAALMGEGHSEKTIAGVRNAMLDDTSSPYGTLANVIDGCTLFAQSFDTIEARESLERTASKIMVRA